MDSLTIPGPYGAIPIRVYRAAAEPAPNPALVWAHGGGFAWGDLEMPEAHWVSQQLAARGITVVSVDYRLAPVSAALTVSEPARAGVLFPVASEEVAAAVGWAAAHAAAYGIDPARFCDYYAANGWKAGRSPMKDWQAAVRNWERRDADERKEAEHETPVFGGW